MQEPGPLTWKGRLIASGIGFVLLLIMAEIVLRIAMPHWREYYSGWFMSVINVPDYGRVSIGRPGFEGYFAQNNGDFRVSIKINEFGLRNNEPIGAADDRIWVVGDSMTFGWGIEEDEIYSSVIEKKLSQETYNIASPGTDICGYQALLARMPKSVTPRAVVMGLILENDIREYDCVEKARREVALASKDSGTEIQNRDTFKLKEFMTQNAALYNFFAVSLKRVAILKEVLTLFGIIRAADIYKDPLSGGELKKAIEKSINEIVVFQKQLPVNTPFLVVIAPGRFELLDSDSLYATLRNKVGNELKAHEINFVDPFNSFNKVGYASTHFAHDGHWTVLGHKLAGEAASVKLSQMLKENQ